MRALFNQSLKNVTGKVRTERRWGPVDVPEGIDQVLYSIINAGRLILTISQSFVQFDCSSPKDELEKRFQYFTTQVRYYLSFLLLVTDASTYLKLLPGILKSAVQSANTVVFVPSSFDFIRVQNHFRKNVGVSFAVLSE